MSMKMFPYTVGLSGVGGLTIAFVITFLVQIVPAGLVFWLTRRLSVWLRMGAAALVVVATSLIMSLYLVSIFDVTAPLVTPTE